MPLATIHKMGQGSDLYHVHFLSDAERPDNTLPGGGEHPWRPGHRPGHNPAFPDNSLPSGPPPHVAPGSTLVLVRDPEGVWHYATLPPGGPPPVVAPPIAPTPAPKG